MQQQLKHINYLGAIILIALSSLATARDFSSATYDIRLSEDCTDTQDACEQITFTALNKTTGSIEVLRGKKIRASTSRTHGQPKNSSKDRYIYTFTAPNDGRRVITYDARYLKLVKGKVVFEEHGEWVQSITP